MFPGIISSFCDIDLCVLSSFAIILLSERF